MTRSNRSPAAAQAGSISAALPTSAIETRLAVARPPRAPRRAPRRGSCGQPVDVADVEPAPGARLVDLDRDADAVVHRDRQRLGPAHAAEARGERHASRGECRRSAGGPPRRTSRTCPGGSPGCRCRSTSRRSSGRTSSGPCARGRGSRPTSPIGRRGSSSRSAPAARTGGSAARRPACRTGPAASRRRRAVGARRRSRRTPPTTAPPGRCRRTRRGCRDPRRPRGRGCSSACGGPPPAPSRGRTIGADHAGAARTGRGPAGVVGGGHPAPDVRSWQRFGRRRCCSATRGVTELASHDGEARVRDRHREPDRFPECGRRGAGRVRVGADLGERLDDRETTLGEVVADRRRRASSPGRLRVRPASSRCT